MVDAEADQHERADRVGGHLAADAERLPGLLGGAHRARDRAQDRGMKRLVERSDFSVVAIDGQKILGQVVGAEAQEVDLARELLGLRRRRGHLDHDAERHVLVEAGAFSPELAPRLLEELLRPPDFLHARDHRQEHAHAAVGAGAENRPELHLEEIRQLERDADRAPAEKGVLFLGESQIVRILVGAEVERAERHPLRTERVDHATVEAKLFFLVGEVSIGEERKLRAIEADPLGPVAMSERQVAHQPDVRFEGDAMTVERLGGQIVQRLELAIEGAVLAVEPFVLRGDVARRTHVDGPRVSVDDQRIALVDGLEQRVDSDHGGDLEGFREDRRVRGRAAGRQRDARQTLRLDRRQIRERQLFGDEDAAFGQLAGLFFDAEQVAKQAMTDVAHVRGTLAEIAVRHARERAGILVDGELKGGFRRESVFDEAVDLFQEALVFEHHPVRVEKARIHFRNPVAHPRLQVLDLADGLTERLLEALPLRRGIVATQLADLVEGDERAEHVCRADSESRRRRHADEPRRARGLFGRRLARVLALFVSAKLADRRDHPLAILVSLLLLRLQRLGEPELHDDPRHLRGDRLQEPEFVAAEASPPERLDHEHAERFLAIEDRHAEKRVVTLLAGLGEILVSGVRERIDDHHRLEPLEHEAGQAFVEPHAHLADGRPVEPLGRPQRELAGTRLVDVERADLRVGAFRDHANDRLERLLEIVGARDDGADVLEHGETVGSAPCARVIAASALDGRLSLGAIHAGRPHDSSVSTLPRSTARVAVIRFANREPGGRARG